VGSWGGQKRNRRGYVLSIKHLHIIIGNFVKKEGKDLTQNWGTLWEEKGCERKERLRRRTKSKDQLIRKDNFNTKGYGGH